MSVSKKLDIRADSQNKSKSPLLNKTNCSGTEIESEVSGEESYDKITESLARLKGSVQGDVCNVVRQFIGSVGVAGLHKPKLPQVPLPTFSNAENWNLPEFTTTVGKNRE